MGAACCSNPDKTSLPERSMTEIKLAPVARKKMVAH
jgi:hypothetical protein